MNNPPRRMGMFIMHQAKKGLEFKVWSLILRHEGDNLEIRGQRKTMLTS